jgi:hypothetical protein
MINSGGISRALRQACVCLPWLFLGALAACTLPGGERTMAGEPPAKVAPAPSAEVAVAPPTPATTAPSLSDPYDVEPEPLTVADCGRCHVTHFRQIRQDGGQHRFDCRECHEVFHAYNPIRGNFAELMPECAQCHTPPHGEKNNDCLACHENPHTPLRIPFSDRLVSTCGECHQSPAAQLKQFPSAHSEQGCQTCHPQSHGKILNCFECHKPHFEKQPLTECVTCHQVHKPLQIALLPNSSTKTCGDCHSEVLEKWTRTPSRHGQVNCGECHTSHGSVPQCSSCHPSPHSEGMLAKFTSCLECHVDAHDLPVR